MESRRIVMTSTFYPPFHLGGDAVHVRYLAEELARLGHEVHVVFSMDAWRMKSGGKAPEPTETPVRLHPVEGALGTAGVAMTHVTGRNRSAERTLRAVLDETRPDWVHHHNVSLLGAGVLRFKDVPSLYTAHDHWLVCQRNDMMRAGREACRGGGCLTCSLRSGRPPRLWSPTALEVPGAIAPSRYMASVLRRAGIASSVLPNFVPEPGPVEGDDAPHFIFAGALEAHKGLDALLRAYEASGAEAELRIAGQGSLAGLVDEASRRTKGRIRRLGFMGREELMRHVASAICMVAPSACNENSPLSCIEAMSVGTPLLVSGNGGLPELAEGGCGLVADADGLAPALRRMESDASMRDGMSRACRRRFLEAHSPRAYMPAYLALAGASS